MRRYETEDGLEGYNSDREGSGCLVVFAIAIIASLIVYLRG